MKKLLAVFIYVALFVGCKKNVEANRNSVVDKVPTLTTTTISSITQTSAIGGGDITDDGGDAVTARGVVWSTSPNPIVAYVTKTADGTGIGVFSSKLSGLEANTTYYVRSYATNSVGTAYGNEISFTTEPPLPINPATLTTTAISSVTQNTAACGGNITSDGGSPITARGVVWSISPNPTVDLETKTTDGTGTGSFTSSMDKLITGTKYYVRSYATNSAGTAYGNEVSFSTNGPTASADLKDIDGNVYPTIKICDQIWMATNLNVSRYRNGDVIPQVQDQTEWSQLTTGAWCYYENKTANGTVYGKLYNWYAVTDPRGLAPEGWHIPEANSEWFILSQCLGGQEVLAGQDVAGGKMKSTGTIEQGNGLWLSPNTGASNSSGFSALPGGVRYNDFVNNTFFVNIGKSSGFWSLGYVVKDCVQGAYLYNDSNILFLDEFYLNCTTRETGLSVRCVKN